MIDQLLPYLESDASIKFNIDLSVGSIESWYKDQNVWEGNKSRLRVLTENGQIEFVRPVWSQSVDCSDMEIDCIESIQGSRSFLNHAFGANVTSMFSSYEWPLDVLKTGGIDNFFI